MPISRATSKGRITIPADVRKVLNIEQGDALLFEVESDQAALLRVVKRQRLTDLQGALRATQRFPGKEAVREEVGQARGKRDKGSDRGQRLLKHIWGRATSGMSTDGIMAFTREED